MIQSNFTENLSSEDPILSNNHNTAS